MGTLKELEETNKEWLTVAEVARFLDSDPQAIRMQAHKDKAALGFPIIIIGCHIKIPRVGFINFFKGLGGERDFACTGN